MNTEGFMPDPSTTAKPVSEFTRSELVRLPELSRARQRLRRFLNWLARRLVFWLTRPTVQGLDNVPMSGPVLVIANHLGDADVILEIAFLPRQIEAIAKIELVDLPILGRIMDAYGVIWIRRGQPDRQALRAALDGLSGSRMVMIAPEGRESLTGALEEATRGAAFLAVRSNALVLPLAITGTQNKRLLANLRRLRKTPVTLTIGQPFQIMESSPTSDPATLSRQDLIEQVTHRMMQRIAVLLPDEYKGVYQEG